MIDQLNVLQKAGLSITVDCFLAFDCISKDFILKTFEKKGFCGDFVRRVLS